MKNTQELASFLGLRDTYRMTQSSVYYEINNVQIRISDHLPNLRNIESNTESIVMIFTENSVSDRDMAILEDALYDLGFEAIYLDRYDPEYEDETKSYFNRNIG